MNQSTNNDQADLTREVAAMIVTSLNLDLSPADLGPSTSLTGDGGLGLDSIDILEVALAVSKHYGFQLRADDEGNTRIFATLESLVRHIAAHRTK